MSDTPRVDAERYNVDTYAGKYLTMKTKDGAWVPVEICAQMERELAAKDATIEKLRAALAAADRMFKHKYLQWAKAGGPNECDHRRAEGIPCPFCDDIIFHQALTDSK